MPARSLERIYVEAVPAWVPEGITADARRYCYSLGICFRLVCAVWTPLTSDKFNSSSR